MSNLSNKCNQGLRLPPLPFPPPPFLTDYFYNHTILFGNFMSKLNDLFSFAKLFKCLIFQVSVFSPAPRKHYLNITPGNILQIYPADPQNIINSQPLVRITHIPAASCTAMHTWV